MFEAATIHATPKISWGQRDTSVGTRPTGVVAGDDIGVSSFLPVPCAVPNVCEAHTIADLGLRGK
jgi:hypothetical protein